MDAGPDFEGALATALNTIRRTIPKMGTRSPRIGRDDLTYERCDADTWVESFWSGQLWLAYAETRDEAFKEAARAQRPYFIARLDRPASHTHDLGFLYTLSLVADYKLTGDVTARAGALRAAEALAGRYNASGRFIRAWNAWSPEISNRGRMIIDCMENLGLLYWAAQESGATRYAEIASAHAHTTADHIVRDDGSSHHTFHFDPDTGAPLRAETHQGYADDSCWSRGQAWGIHGFALAYSYTRDPRFREVAARLADYALAQLPEDRLPLWDYRLPEGEPPYRDTSAAAIMAAGLLLLDDAAGTARYRESARAMLGGLIANDTTAHHPQAEGLLTRGAAHVKQGLANHMLPYGDYFFVEGLRRALGRADFFW